MRTAFKKCRSLTEENKKKEIKINQLEATLKVSDTLVLRVKEVNIFRRRTSC